MLDTLSLGQAAVRVRYSLTCMRQDRPEQERPTPRRRLLRGFVQSFKRSCRQRSILEHCARVWKHSSRSRHMEPNDEMTSDRVQNESPRILIIGESQLA